MRIDRDRLREIGESSFSALSRRGRLLFIGACGLVLVASWWGAQRFADRLLTSIPMRSGPASPTPLTAEEMQEQARLAQELNARLRAQRAAARAFASGEAGALEDSSGAFSPIDWDAGSGAGPGAATVPIEAPAEPIAALPPVLPDLARESGVSGTVIVRALVGADGHVVDTSIERSIPMLNGAAEQAVRGWRFKPATSGGRAVASWARVPVTFAR